jgi:RNA polymerase sigma-70 factor (ECF subfamily)
LSPLLKGTVTLDNLINKVLKGDAKSQESLFNIYAPKMMGICKRYIKNHDDAQDVFQEGFVMMFNNLSRLENIDSFDFWIRRIFINASLQHLRRNHVIVQDIEEVYDYQCEEEDAVSQLSAKEILALLNQLPLGYKTVFNLFVVEGYSHKEIGETLGIEEATSRSQLAKARRMLQDKISELNTIAI